MLTALTTRAHDQSFSLLVKARTLLLHIGDRAGSFSLVRHINVREGNVLLACTRRHI